jgi:hypothetical protein
VKAFTTTLMIFGVFAIVVILFVIAGVILYAMTPPLKLNIIVSPVTADASKSFDNKVDTFKRDVTLAASAREKKEFSLILSENEINSKIVEQIAEGKFSFKEMVVSLHPDVAWTCFTFDNQGIPAKVGVIATAVVEKGSIKWNISNFQLGMLPLSNSVNTYATSLVNIFSAMNNPLENLPLEITGVKFDDKKLTIKVMSKPAS